MATNFGIKSETKFRVLHWLAQQLDVKMVYYGTSEVNPKKDAGRKLQGQILQWGCAALGLSDSEYYLQYDGGTSEAIREELTNVAKHT